MTNRPDLMTVRPGAPDLLSDVLRGVRLTGALYYRVSTSYPWPPVRVPIGFRTSQISPTVRHTL